MAIYTEDAANQIDDITYEYMKNGDYVEGLRNWAENFRLICLTGSPLTPDIQERAWRYPDHDSIRINNLADDLLRTTEHERYDPVRTKSSGRSF